jgi:hypothetical protein
LTFIHTGIASIASIANMRYSEVMSIATREPITLPATEQGQVRDLERMLDEWCSSAGHVRRTACRSSNGIQFLEASPWQKASRSLPDNQVLTTQRAADPLGMSRPFFIKLLETVYPPRRSEFARKRDEERQAASTTSRQAVEVGLHDRNVMPEGGG